MNRIAKGCAMRFISVLIVVILIRYGRSAPSNSDSEYTHAGHRTKRSTGLINILSNMLQKHSAAVGSDWMDFSNTFDDEYEATNWNSFNNNNLQPDSDNNFVENFEDNIIFGDTLDTNCATSLENISPEQESNDVYPLADANYNHNETPMNANWNPDDGDDSSLNYDGADDSQRYLQEGDLGYRLNSNFNWNDAIPSYGNMEIDEMISKNFYMTPPILDSSIGNPWFYNNLTPNMRKWGAQGSHFLPANHEVASQVPLNTYVDKRTKLDFLNCSPDLPKKGVDEQVPDERKHKQMHKNIEDEYIVLLIKKDHVFADRRKNNTSSTPNHYHHGKNHTQIRKEEDLSSHNNATIGANHTVNDSNESEKGPAGDEDLSTPYNTTYEASITESSFPDTSSILNNFTESFESVSVTAVDEDISAPCNTTCSDSITDNYSPDANQPEPGNNVSVTASDEHSRSHTTYASSSTKNLFVVTSTVVYNSTKSSNTIQLTTEYEDVGSLPSTTSTTTNIETSSATTNIVDNSTESSENVNYPIHTTHATSSTESTSPGTSLIGSSTELSENLNVTVGNNDASSPVDSTHAVSNTESTTPDTSIVASRTESNENLSVTVGNEYISSPIDTTHAASSTESTSPDTGLMASSTESKENVSVTARNEDVSSPFVTIHPASSTESTSPDTGLIANSTESNENLNVTVENEDVRSPIDTTHATRSTESISPDTGLIASFTESNENVSVTAGNEDVGSPIDTTDPASSTESTSPDTSLVASSTESNGILSVTATNEPDTNDAVRTTESLLASSTESNENLSVTAGNEDLSSPIDTTDTASNTESTSPDTSLIATSTELNESVSIMATNEPYTNHAASSTESLAPINDTTEREAADSSHSTTSATTDSESSSPDMSQITDNPTESNKPLQGTADNENVGTGTKIEKEEIEQDEYMLVRVKKPKKNKNADILPPDNKDNKNQVKDENQITLFLDHETVVPPTYIEDDSTRTTTNPLV